MRNRLCFITAALVVLAMAAPVRGQAQQYGAPTYQQGQNQQGQYQQGQNQQGQYQQGQYQQGQNPQGPTGAMDITGGWSTEVQGPQGVTRAAAVYGSDGTFVTLMQLPNGSMQKIWGTYRATQVSQNQVQLSGQVQGWLPHQICSQAPGFPVQCQPYSVPQDASLSVQFMSPSMIEADGATWNRDPSPALLQQNVPDQVLNNVPAPVQPIIPQPVMPGPQPINPNPGYAGGSHCDDLQQERICAVNDGNIVVSGGCERCISP